MLNYLARWTAYALIERGYAAGCNWSSIWLVSPMRAVRLLLATACETNSSPITCKAKPLAASWNVPISGMSGA